MRCPGQNTQYWLPSDIFNLPCPACGEEIEFFKDDSQRKCPKCGYRLKNPKLDEGCAEWCPYGEKCTELLGEEEDE